MKRTLWKRVGTAVLLMALASTAFARFTFLFRKVPKDWVRYEGSKFSMMIPPGLVRSEITGEDSVLIRFVSADFQIDVSEGWYAGGAHDPLPIWKNYSAEPIGVCNEGKLLSYIGDSKSAPDGRKYAAHVVCSKIGETAGQSDGLTVNTYSLTTEARGWAVQLYGQFSSQLNQNDEKRKRRVGTLDERSGDMGDSC